MRVEQKLDMQPSRNVFPAPTLSGQLKKDLIVKTIRSFSQLILTSYPGLGTLCQNIRPLHLGPSILIW